MAYELEGKDLVINGFEKGISDAPELGIADMRSVNITSVPGEASVGFATAGATKPPTGVSGASYSVNGATNVVTVSSTSGYYNGMAITLDTLSPGSLIESFVVAGGAAGGNANTSLCSGGGGAGGVNDNIAAVFPIGTYAIGIGSGGSAAAGAGVKGTNGIDSGIYAQANNYGATVGSISATNTTTSLSSGNFTGPSGTYNCIFPNGETRSVSFTNGSQTITWSGGLLVSCGAGNLLFYTGSAIQSATGGGAGGGTNGGTVNNGSNGGSGGGGGAGSSGSGAGGTGVVGQGSAGGGGTLSPQRGSGGGGGAGGAGGTSSGNTYGASGPGLASSISGSSVTYAVGGTGASVVTGAGTQPTTPGSGGNGSENSVGGVPGVTGTTIIAYPTGYITATGGTMTTSGGMTIHTFTSIGSFTVSTNPVTTGTYYLGNLSGNTFKLYYDPSLNNLVSFNINSTGTYSVKSFGTPVWSSVGIYTFILDTSGSVWYLPMSGSTPFVLQYMANTGHSASVTNSDFGICQWKSYLFVFIGHNIDYVDIGYITSGGISSPWVYGWKTDLSSTNYQHYAMPATDDAIYFCNNQSIGSILEEPNSTFNPTDSTTYIYNLDALVLPTYDFAQYIAQLGPYLLVGGISYYVYPWDRVSLSFAYPLICADQNIVRIVSTNSNAYVFAGTRGRIYITNGTQMQLYKKIPDSLSGAPEPYYQWGDAIFYRNKLHFSFTSQDNAGTPLNTTGGIWSLGIDAGQTAIDLPTAGSLFGEAQLSYGTYGGEARVLFPMSQLATPPGYGIGAGWVFQLTTGVDISTSRPYTNYQTYIVTDLIPIGTFYKPMTGQQVEYKLSRALAIAESVRFSYRTNLGDAFTQFWESTNVGAISDALQLPFQKFQWIQLKVELKSVSSNPSYVRLTEIRLR